MREKSESDLLPAENFGGKHHANDEGSGQREKLDVTAPISDLLAGRLDNLETGTS